MRFRPTGLTLRAPLFDRQATPVRSFLVDLLDLVPGDDQRHRIVSVGPTGRSRRTLLRSLFTAGRFPHALRDLLSIVIPAPDGVFVAHLSKSETALEIRTFIDSKGANTDRKAVRDLMIQASEPLLESPLSASPAVELVSLD